MLGQTTSIGQCQLVPTNVTLVNNSTVALVDNSQYFGTNITDIEFTYPQGDFEVYILMTFADTNSGSITVTLPAETQYIGDFPSSFANHNGETWELSIKNGIVVGGQVE